MGNNKSMLLGLGFKVVKIGKKEAYQLDDCGITIVWNDIHETGFALYEEDTVAIFDELGELEIFIEEEFQERM